MTNFSPSAPTFPCMWYSPIESRMKATKASPSPKLVACFSANSLTPYQSWSKWTSLVLTTWSLLTDQERTSATRHCQTLCFPSSEHLSTCQADWSAQRSRRSGGQRWSRPNLGAPSCAQSWSRQGGIVNHWWWQVSSCPKSRRSAWPPYWPKILVRQNCVVFLGSRNVCCTTPACNESMSPCRKEYQGWSIAPASRTTCRRSLGQAKNWVTQKNVKYFALCFSPFFVPLLHHWH